MGTVIVCGVLAVVFMRQALIPVVIAGAIALGYKLVQPFLARSKDMRISENAFGPEGNPALSLSRSMQCLAIALALGGALKSPGIQLISAQFGIDVGIALVVVVAATFTTDKWLLRGINNKPALISGNLAVGVVEACSYIATGFITGAALINQANKPISGIGFSLGGLAILAALYTAYDKLGRVNIDDTLFQASEHPSADTHTRALACAVEVGSFLVAGGFLVALTLAGHAFGLWSDLVVAIEKLAGGLGVLVVVTAAAKALVQWRTKIGGDEHHGDIALAFATAAFTTAATVLVAFCF